MSRRKNNRVSLPDFNVYPVFRKKIRYISSADEKVDSQTVTSSCLLNLLYVQLGSSNFIAKNLFGSVKLEAVHVYATPSASAFKTCSILWFGNKNPDINWVGTGTSDHLSHVGGPPPKASFASMWFSVKERTSPTSLFTITAPSGSICDVTFSFTLLDQSAINGPPSNLTSTTTAADEGKVFYNTLDNTLLSLAAGANLWTAIVALNLGTAYG